MEYVYTQTDLLASPQAYMYPKYGGDEFIAAWRSSRMPFLQGEGVLALAERRVGLEQTLAALALHQEEQTASVNRSYGEGGTEEFLHNARKDPRAAWTGKSRDVLYALMRRFEIKKKLPIGLPPSWDRDIMVLEPYARFSLLLGVAALDTGDLRLLNCLAKVNDLLCSQQTRGEAVPAWRSESAWGIACEVNAVDTLLAKGRG